MTTPHQPPPIQSDKQSIVSRPPVVVVMGHVDHGKSTLLDFIRKTNIVAREAGGITQHVAAYEVETDHGGKKQKITFLDTPGHEAFKAIRSRGAKIADIAILVVSAEDSVKTQTLEALEHIKESKTPFIVAINKMDLPGANVEKAKFDLVEHGVYLEGLGGDIPNITISAKQGTHIPELLDLILLVAEVEGLTVDQQQLAEGFVIEASLDGKKGIVATLVIKNGTLTKGQFVVAGESFAPVRSIETFSGQSVESATASTPVKIGGWTAMPPAGVDFAIAKTKSEAEEIAAKNKNATPDQEPNEHQADRKVIPLIVKGDVSGTVEAVKHEIEKIKNDRLRLKIISSGTGNITEADMKSAGGDKETIVIGFNVKVDSSAASMAERSGITIKTDNIIYKLSEWLTAEMLARTPKIMVDRVDGQAKILKIFSQDKDRQIIGGVVTEGILSTKSVVNIVRRGTIIGQGKLGELQKFKAKVEKIENENEFGAMIESKITIAAGDTIECVKTVEA